MIHIVGPKIIDALGYGYGTWAYEIKALSKHTLELAGWILISTGMFAGGLVALCLAIASPLDAFSSLLLSAHMVQHLLLMSVAPPLILLGAPLLPLLRGLPRKIARDGVAPFLIWPALRRIGNAVTNPLSCWIVMAGTLSAWHVPAAFDLALRSPGWPGGP